MKTKILEFLKGKLNGVQVAYLDGVAEVYSKTITKEEDIETTFSEGVLNLLKTSAAFAQKEGDKRATEAAKTAVQGYEQKHNLKDGEKVDPTKTDTPPAPVSLPDDAPEYVKAIMKQNEVLSTALKGVTEKLEGFEADKKKESNAQTATEALGASKVLPDSLKQSWVNRINPESDTPITDQVAELEKEYNDLHTSIVGDNIPTGGLPRGGENNGEASDDEVSDILNKM